MRFPMSSGMTRSPVYKEFGAAFGLLGSSEELHETPFGTAQQFLCCYSRLE
jgi:hypothetical protein